MKYLIALVIYMAVSFTYFGLAYSENGNALYEGLNNPNEIIEQVKQNATSNTSYLTELEDMLSQMAGQKDPRLLPLVRVLYLELEESGLTLSRLASAERELASKYTYLLAVSTLEIQETPEKIQESPEEADIAMDALEAGTEFSTRLRELRDKVKAKYQNKSTIGKVASVGATFIPFATWFARNDAVDIETGSSFLPGNNLSEQISAVWKVAINQSPASAIALLEEAVDEVSTVSDFDAVSFIEAFHSYSSSDRFWSNILNPVVSLIVSVFLYLIVGRKISANFVEKISSRKRQLQYKTQSRIDHEKHGLETQIDKHFTTLQKHYADKIVTNEYGATDFSDWHFELDRFFLSVEYKPEYMSRLDSYKLCTDRIKK